MNHRLVVLLFSLIGVFVLLIGVLRWGNAAASHPLSPSSTPQRVGAGSGYFYDSGQRLGNGDSWGVALGDLDGDGDLDAFVGNGLYADNGQPQPNEVWLNDGRGRFVSNGQALGNEFTGPVALADFDGDLDLDAMVVNYKLLSPGPQGGAQVWLNDGSGQFTDRGQLLDPNLHDYSGLTVGDVDGDNDIDAFIPGFDNTPLWLNQGDGTFINSSQILGTLWDPILADVDNDGDLDLVTAHSIWWNMGGNQGGTLGQFVNSGQPFGNANIVSVAVGDLDGDGDQDALLAPSNCATCASQVWLNNGSGIFSNSGQDMGMGLVYDVVLGDLDGDDDLDAYLSQPFYEEWTDNEDNGVWFNDGNGLFTDSYQSLGQGISPNIALGDLNGDSTLDAFVAMAMEWDWVNGQAIFEAPNQVWLNKPQADLAMQQAAQVNGQTVTYTLTYINNGPDLVLGAMITDTLNPALSNVTVNSSGAVITQVGGVNLAWQVAPLPAGSGGVIRVRGTFAGEIPGNVAEIAAANHDPLPQNNQAYAHALHVNTIIPAHNAFPIPQTSPLAITFSRDILPATVTSQTLIVHGEQTGRYEGTFTVNNDELIWQPVTPFKPGETIAVYLDQNLTTAGGTTPLQPYQQQFRADVGVPSLIGTGIFTPTYMYTTTSAMNVSLGDLDGDGDLDAFIVSDLDWSNPCSCYPGIGAEVWLNNGGQQGGTPGTYSNSGQTLGGLYPHDVTLGDVDNDGDLDAFIPNWAPEDWPYGDGGYRWNNHNELWLNDGQGFFTRSEQYLGYQGSYSVDFGDVDGDHDLDAIVANNQREVDGTFLDGRNELWLNDGQGHFTHSGQLLGDDGGLDVSLGDLDNDGDLDVFIVFADTSRVWLNQGGLQGGTEGQFIATTQDWSVIPAAYSVELADLDNDDDLDAMITTFDASPTQVWLNDGTGYFTPGDLLTPGSAYDPDLGDLDGDGDIDAFSWSEDSYIITDTVWLNDGSAQFTVGYQTNEMVGLADLGDLDGDGDLDIFGVVGEQVSIWLNVDDLAIEGVAAANDSPTPFGQTTTFTATVTAGSNVVYTWAFGDGQTATGATVSHVYANPGVYTATVTASNSLGQLIATTQVAIIVTVYQQYLPLIIKP
ncbi:MAG: VCBS repeat-containing protein [Chloroflexi bacterium]|nr:VCBS repeat-containing protein [Chloroflexota bacterium]MBP8056751.1 VCBS repeat-containing protein [Chloroflexota bacterium]